MTLDKKKFKTAVIRELKTHFRKTPEEATTRELFDAVSYAVKDTVLSQWLKTNQIYEKKDVKQAYYLSAEFLMGRALSNNLVNLLIEEDVKEALEEMGFSYNEIEDSEPDAGLGNGGLGRLAACFLDSLATLDLPGHGYGIRYRYGMFEQKIENGYQVEYPDKWLENGDPWAICRRSEAVEVKFGGRVAVYKDEEGRDLFRREDTEIIRAVPYDTPIIGYNTDTVNTLRLWEAESPEEFDLQLFNDQKYTEAVVNGNIAEDISRVLYPNDSGPSGKALRLRQQYFFVSASLQDIVRKYKQKHGNDFSVFAEKVAIQLNDTHPVVAIPELMRIFLDWEKLGWDEAWKIVSQTCAYTNHTILAEALELWPVNLFAAQLPRIYQIVEEINRRFMMEVHRKHPGDWQRFQRMSIIGDGVIRMAWLAIVGSHSVNGVAALHTEILKNQELKDWYEFFPEKFNNKTNGVTQRRWLLKCNPGLSSMITETIGDHWTVKLSDLEKIEAKINTKMINRFIKLKHESKVQLADYIKKHNQVEVDPNSIFDVQIKRLHEYKRQLLNVLHIMYLYNRMKKDPDFKKESVSRTFIFGAKAASGYYRAKLIIKLINNVADKINNDPDIDGKIKVVYLENYRVSLAEKIFPASDVSEQISTAGKEASGTGNMKFMMNGALTLGTLDGANVEIVEEVGEENAFIFGLKAEEVAELNRNGGYNPWDFCAQYPDVREVVDQLIDGTYNGNEHYEIFRELYDSLMHGVDGNRPDLYYVLYDLPAYIKAQERVAEAYKDKKKWAKMALLNIARSGKFSSDRTISEYAKEIWNIKAVKSK